jgi:predicted aconitase
VRDQVIQNETVQIVKLARERSSREQDWRLVGYRFARCHIEGPAVLLAESEIEISRPAAFGASLEAMLWPIDSERAGFSGVIPLRDCLFEGCSFHWIGWAGVSDFIERLREFER